MKTVMLAVLASVAIADDCNLHSDAGKLELTCTIPGVTTISSECCRYVQKNLDDTLHDQKSNSEDYLEAMQACESFRMYMNQHVPGGPPPSSPREQLDQVINALPDGLRCTESIKGGGESACELHANEAKLGVTCEIPAKTTITSGCCSALQGTIDHFDIVNGRVGNDDLNNVMQSCQSVQSYVMQHMPHGPPPRSPVEGDMQIINSLPGGLSCTEKAISGGDMLSVYADRAIVSKIGLAAGIGITDVSNEASAMSLVVSGIVGLLAGALLMAGVRFRYSKQRGNQQPLLTEPTVA